MFFIPWCWKSWKIPIRKKASRKMVIGRMAPSLTSYLPILSLPSLPFLFNLHIYRKPNHGMNDKLVKLTKKSLLCWCKCNLVALLCTVALIMLSNIWDLWPLRHFLRVIRKHGLTNKKTKTKTMTNTFWEHLQMTIQEKLRNCWHFWQLRTPKHYNHTGQRLSQFLRCLISIWICGGGGGERGRVNHSHLIVPSSNQIKSW